MLRSDQWMKKGWLVTAVWLIFTLLAANPGVCAPVKKVAVVPFTMNAPDDLRFLQNGLFSMLSSRISDPGKVVVLERERVDQAMADVNGGLTESKSRILGKKLGVDYVLFGSLTQFGQSVSLDASMVDVTGEKPTLSFFEQSGTMGDVIPLVNKFAGDVNRKVFNREIANALYEKQAPEEPQAPGSLQYAGGGRFVRMNQAQGNGFATHLKLEGMVCGMVAGDLNHDGVLRVVLATDHTLLIHRFKGRRLMLEKKLEFDNTHRIVALDMADINRNGFPELFVTSMNIHRDGLQSFVVEYNGSQYVTLQDKTYYYYRVMDGPLQSKILLGQKKGKDPFSGRVYIMSAADHTYTPDKKLRMPRSVSVLSLAKGPVTSPDGEEYVFINGNGRLSVASDTARIEWQGKDKFGGTAHYFLLPSQDTDASYRVRVYLHPRIQFYDVDDDGHKEVFAVKNQELGGGSFGRYKRFTRGSVEVLSWNGIALVPAFETRAVQGWISDFSIVDLDGDGKDEMLVSVVDKTKLTIGPGGETTNIISYRLK